MINGQHLPESILTKEGTFWILIFHHAVGVQNYLVARRQPRFTFIERHNAAKADDGADDAFRSLQAGRIIPMLEPKTVADGLRTSLGELTFPIIQRCVHQIVTVTDEAIIKAMRLVWERMKVVIEPSAAVPVAALLEGNLDVSKKRVAVILSGGNVDLDRLPWMQGSA